MIRASTSVGNRRKGSDRQIPPMSGLWGLIFADLMKGKQIGPSPT